MLRVKLSSVDLESLALPSGSLPGLTGQSSIHGRWLLDRPVKPGDDSKGLSSQSGNASAASNHEVATEEGLRFLSSRTGEKRLRGRALAHSAAEHEHDLAGEAAGLPEIMGREHDFHARCGDLHDYIFHGLGGGRVKIRGRLVEKQNFRIAGEGTGKGEAL